MLTNRIWGFKDYSKVSGWSNWLSGSINNCDRKYRKIALYVKYVKVITIGDVQLVIFSSSEPFHSHPVSRAHIQGSTSLCSWEIGVKRIISIISPETNISIQNNLVCACLHHILMRRKEKEYSTSRCGQLAEHLEK